jgi:hypothetical protein
MVLALELAIQSVIMLKAVPKTAVRSLSTVGSVGNEATLNWG